MALKLNNLLPRGLRLFLARQSEHISEINRRYAKPKTKMTRMVSFALLLLRLYLIFLVGILFFKFFTLLKK
jgi:hypothetical protein